MNGELFERCLVEAIYELAEEKGLKHKPLAIRAWPHRKDPGTKWRKIRNGLDPRGLQVCDAYDLVDALGENFLEVCALAQMKMKRQTGLSEKGALPPKIGQREKQPAMPGGEESLRNDFADVPGK